jgi:hypothetical protein
MMMFDDDYEEELEDERFLHQQCRSVRGMTKGELFRIERDIRAEAEGTLGGISDSEREEPVTFQDISSLDFFMRLYRAIEREAKKRELVLPPWKARNATMPVLRWFKVLQGTKGRNVLEFRTMGPHTQA